MNQPSNRLSRPVTARYDCSGSRRRGRTVTGGWAGATWSAGVGGVSPVARVRWGARAVDGVAGRWAMRTMLPGRSDTGWRESDTTAESHRRLSAEWVGVATRLDGCE